jgi:hypothetical protein
MTATTTAIGLLVNANSPDAESKQEKRERPRKFLDSSFIL